ncbi:MAG: CRISPR-associated endonuclease Cas2 [Candidatus Schekmanbacteria bacterium]|nr:MAG: CRISPR-associated endonuclease Cas2 [Candidatus Schekmanbacteria bacterium]
MHVVISYDIVNDRRRIKLAKVLLDYGKRVQKSVFECSIDEKNFDKLKKKVEKIIDYESDSVRYYFLCKKCKENIVVSGEGIVIEDEEIIIW